MMNANNHMYIM